MPCLRHFGITALEKVEGKMMNNAPEFYLLHSGFFDLCCGAPGFLKTLNKVMDKVMRRMSTTAMIVPNTFNSIKCGFKI
jgi:hypothetical protein